MKEQLELLQSLQTIDLELDSSRQEMERIRQQLQDHKDILLKLTTDLDLQKAQLKETTALKTERQEELREADERYTRSKARLMDISSAKEYNALEKEMEQLKRKVEETREQLDHLKEAIEVYERSISEKEEKILDLRAHIENADHDAEGQITRLGDRITTISAQREAAQKDIKIHIIKRYEFIRNRRDGQAIVAESKGHCEGCFMRIPPQLVIELQRESALIACPSCQRLLIHKDPDTDNGSAER